MPVALASLVAFGAGAVFSYFGHRLFTFRSKAAHGRSLSRFAGVNALAYATATGLPWILCDRMGFAPLAGILAVCIVVPVMNFTLLNFYVFRQPPANASQSRND